MYLYSIERPMQHKTYTCQCPHATKIVITHDNIIIVLCTSA